MNLPHRSLFQARWQALTESDRPTLPPALRVVAHTFLDPNHPELSVPSEAILRLFETRSLYLPRLDWLGLVALAALSPGPRSRPQEYVCSSLLRLSRLFAETAIAVGGEQHVVPAVHYRPGFLSQHRPSMLSVEDTRELEAAYGFGLRAIELWLTQAPQTEAVLAHRLPALAAPLDVLTQRLPTELQVVTDRLRVHQNTFPYTLALRLLCDEASTPDVPWTSPLLTWIADLPARPPEFTGWWDTLKAVHAELLCRWQLAGSPSALDGLPRYTPEDEQRAAVRAYRTISRQLQAKATENPEEHWRQLTLLPYSGPGPGWALLEGKIDPRLLKLCEATVPSEALKQGGPKKIIGFLARRPRSPEFLTRLTLMAVSLTERGVSSSTQLGYLMYVSRYLERIFTHSNLKPDEFDPAVHLLELFQSAGVSAGLSPLEVRERMHLDTNYASCAGAVDAFIAAHPADADWLNIYRYGPVPDTALRPLREAWYRESEGLGDPQTGQGERSDVLNDTQSAIVDHYDRIMILAEFRYVLIRELMYQIRQVQHDNRLAGVPYPWKVDFQVPDEQVTWHFQLWDPLAFARLHVPADRTVTLPVNGRMFMEFVGATAQGDVELVDPWFLEPLQMQMRSKKERAEYLESIQMTDSSFAQASSFQNAPYRLREFKTFIRAVVKAAPDSRFDQRCYADPDELYMDVLMAICLLRFVRTTGSRLHEYLQLRLDLMREIKADEEPIWALPGSMLEETVWVASLSPKGRKGATAVEDERVDMYVDDSVQNVITAIVHLRIAVEGTVSIAKPQNIAVLHQEDARYVVQNGKRVLSQEEVMRKVKFLLLGWQSFTGSSADIHLRAHPLRNGFVHGALAEGSTFKDLRQLLNHANENTSASYARLTKRQAASGGPSLMPLDEQNRQTTGKRPEIREQPSPTDGQGKNGGVLQQLYLKEQELITLEEALRQRQKPSRE